MTNVFKAIFPNDIARKDTHTVDQHDNLHRKLRLHRGKLSSYPLLPGLLSRHDESAKHIAVFDESKLIRLVQPHSHAGGRSITGFWDWHDYILDPHMSIDLSFW